MRPAHIKNWLIIILSAVCAVLILRVWFGPRMGFDVFAEWLRPLFRERTAHNLADMIKPYRFIAENEETAHLAMNNARNAALNEVFTALMEHVLKNGEFAELGAVNMTERFSGGVILCEYLIEMPSDAFNLAAAAQNNAEFQSRIGAFDAVMIARAGDFVNVGFIHYSGDTAAVFRVRDTVPDIFAAFSEAETLPIDYISLNIPPVFAEQSYGANYNTAVVILPFADENGALMRNFIQEKISFLFDNPNRIVSDSIGGYIFHEGNVRVTYDVNHVMEYSFHGAIPRGGNTFTDAYEAASSFMRNDRNLATEWFCAGYENVDDEWIFYFDYIAGNHPVVLINAQRKDIGMEHMIEITVENGVVKKYRRLMCNFNLNGGIVVAASGITEAYESIGGLFSVDDDINPIGARVGYSININWFGMDFETAIRPIWFFEDWENDGIISSTAPILWRDRP